MKKLMLLVAMLAMVVVAAAPALAQLAQGFEEETESGEVEQEFSVSNTGSNSNQCVGFSGFANTGNLQNEQGAVQYFPIGGDVGFEGAGFEFAPESETECEQSVQQSSAASS